jgi:hypothetical protein
VSRAILGVLANLGRQWAMLERTKQPPMNVVPQAEPVPDLRPLSTRPEDALLELYELLETYAPFWYTEGHHDRAEAALRLDKPR